MTQRVVKKVLIFFVVPLGLSSILMGMYFSGNEGLQQVISPRIPPMNPASMRELGLLENLQNLLLLIMIVTAVVGYRKQTEVLQKGVMVFVASFAVFILLEEIDYGLHYYEYAKKIPWKDSATRRNLHNVGDTTQIVKQTVDVGMAILFVVVPLAFAKSKNSLLRFFSPDRYSILTIIVMVLVRTIAHELRDRGFGTQGTIDKNLSEFRELIIYYVFMLYLFTIALQRHFVFDSDDDTPADAAPAPRADAP